MITRQKFLDYVRAQRSGQYGMCDSEIRRAACLSVKDYDDIVSHYDQYAKRWLLLSKRAANKKRKKQAASKEQEGATTAISVNPLPLIAAWLEAFHGGDVVIDPPTRSALTFWVESLDYYPKNDPRIELAVDCLIVAGIGRKQEQLQTVYCRASH